MKIALFIIGLLSFATLTNAGTFLEAKHRARGVENLSPEALVNNLKQTDFGKSILNLVSLQFKTSGKLDDVNVLISDLQSQLRQQQSEDDQRYAQTTESNNQVIATQTDIVNKATAKIASNQEQLVQAQSALSQLQVTQQRLIQQRDEITAAIQQATQQRAQDAENFAERVKNQQTLISGIQKTLALFQQAVSSGRYDAEKVDRLVGLLQSLEAAFAASVAQDQQLEAQAIQDFEDFLLESNNRLAEIAEQLQAIAIEITTLQTLITQLNDEIVAATLARTNAQALVDRTVQAQQELDAKYTSNRAVRADQIRLLSSAIQTLNGNSVEVQNYLNQA